MAFRSIPVRVESCTRSKPASWIRLSARVCSVLVLLLAMAGVASASGSKETAAKSSLIKVGIVNLPPEESGYRQANVEDMNNAFSKANGYEARQTNTGDNSSAEADLVTEAPMPHA